MSFSRMCLKGSHRSHSVLSYLLVCQESEEIHPGPEHQRSEGLDQPDEENNPDSGVPGSAI